MDDVPHGVGRSITNFDTYVGEFTFGLRNGTGMLEHADGRVYEGNFFHGKASGHGVMDFAGGERYEGAFRAGMM